MADPVLVPAWVPITSAFAGGIAVAVANFATNWQNRKSEERKHLRSLLFNSAIENWKHNSTTAIELMKLGKSVEVMPLESYVVSIVTLSEVLFDTKLDKNNVTSKIKEAFEISDEADKYIIERFHQENKKA